MFKGFTGIISHPISQNELVIEDPDKLNQGQQPGIYGTVLQKIVYAQNKWLPHGVRISFAQNLQIWNPRVQNWDELYLPAHFPIVFFMGFWLFWILYSNTISTVRIGIPAKAVPNQLGFFLCFMSRQKQKDKRLLLLLLCY